MVRRRKHGIADAVREVPVGLFCFELLFADGQDLTRLSYPQRRARLAQAITVSLRLRLTTATEVAAPADLDAAFGQAVTAFEALAAFAGSELGQKYPQAVKVWENAWDRSTPFLAFTPPVRRLLYTTNSIESLNYQLRKVTKARGHFPGRTPQRNWQAQRPVGFQNSATGLDLGFYAARSYSPSRPPRTPAVLPRCQDQEDSHGLGGWLRLARCPVSRDRGPGSGQGPSPRLFSRDARPVRAPAPRHRSQGAGLSPSRRPGTSWKLRNLRRWLFFLALAQYPAKCVITGHPRD
jgi:hypothetical protein